MYNELQMEQWDRMINEEEAEYCNIDTSIAVTDLYSTEGDKLPF